MRFVLTGIICLNLYLLYISFSNVLKDPSITSIAAIQEKIASHCIQSVYALAEKASYIDKHTGKYLAKLQKREAKFQKKCSKVESGEANKTFANSVQEHQYLCDNINKQTQSILLGSGQYITRLDTLSTPLKYFEKSGSLSKINSIALQAKAFLKLNNLIS